MYRDQPASGLHYTIAATVTDTAGLSSTATSSILVSDVAPIASIDGPFSGVAGETLHYGGSLFDAGDFDTVTPAWEVRNMRTGLVVAAGSTMTFDFTPTAPGSYAVMFSGTDDEGATGYAYGGFGIPLTVDQVQVRPDATDPSKSVLAIGGTTKNDNIVLRPDGSGGVRVLLNGASAGVFSPTGFILVYGQAGNDRVSVDSRLGVQLTFFGGDGNDILSSDSATDLLVGGAGHDRVLGTARLID